MKGFGEDNIVIDPVQSLTPSPSPTLAIAAIALLLFPKTTKIIAYGALALYSWQLYRTYQTQGSSAAVASVKSGFNVAKESISTLMKEEQAIIMANVSEYQTENVESSDQVIKVLS